MTQQNRQGSEGTPAASSARRRVNARQAPRTVRVGQVLRDLAPDMRPRDRRLRVLALGDDDRAICEVVHDQDGTTGVQPRIQIKALSSPSKFELLQDAAPVLPEHPRFAELLSVMTAVHRPGAAPHDYARAAWDLFSGDTVQESAR